MGNSNSQATTDLPVSNFYLACRSGDVDTVKQMLPKMKLKEINRIESNGSTALHSAAWYGHFEIVELLLKCGCSTITINKYGKTAAQECEDGRIRQLIQSSSAVLDNDEEINDHAPTSKWNQIYENIDDHDKSVVATKIMKLRLRTYLTNQFKINEVSRTDHIRKIVLQTIDESHREYNKALNVLENFGKTKDPEHLIYLHTIESPFYQYIARNQDEVFYMELFIGLTVFQKRFFSGRTYRGAGLSKVDIDFYLWSWHHRTNFIEIRTIISTSASRQVAKIFIPSSRPGDDGIRTLFIYNFSDQCATAIELSPSSNRQLPSLSKYPDEEEILIIPGTFFEVTSIKKSSLSDDSSDFTIIELKNIPVSREILLKTINELQ